MAVPGGFVPGCFCDFDCVVKRYMRMGVRAGCRYWACPRDRGNCEYMDWIDDPFEGPARDAIYAALEEMNQLRTAQRNERNRMRDEYRTELVTMRNKMLICVLLAAVLLSNGMYQVDDDYLYYDD